MFDFKVSTEDFWGMSMGDFLMLFLRQKEQRRLEDSIVARIEAAVMNTSELINWKQRGNKFFAPSEFMTANQQPKPKRTNGLDVIARFDAYAARTGGGS